MAHDGTGQGWNEEAPANSEPAFPNGAIEIRDIRKGVNIRMSKEHVAMGADSAGGQHKPGSAVAYRQTLAPTQAPNGTPLGAADIGRLWVDDDMQLHQWSGSAWQSSGTDTISIEHTAGGHHRVGSARIYTGASAPTQDPSGRPLGSPDIGRLWLDDLKQLHEFDGTNWTGLKFLPQFSQLTTNGLFQIGDLLFQWGYRVYSGIDMTITFPTPFIEVYGVFMQVEISSPPTWSVSSANVTSLLPNQFSVRTDIADESQAWPKGYWWFAIGKKTS